METEGASSVIGWSGLNEFAGVVLLTWGVKIAGALALLIAGLLVARAVRGGVRKAMARAGIDATLVPFLSGIAYYLVVAVVVTAALQLFGIETTSIIAVLGAAGFAVGLAMQGTLSNFSAGVMLLIFRPFRAGDFIDAAGVAGTVAEIGIFSTTLDTPDNVRIIVPNSVVYGQTIKNYAANPTRRVDLGVGVSYDDDLGVVAETLERIVRADSRVLSEPAAVVAVSELGDSSVNFVVRPWCRREDYWQLKWDLTREFKLRLEAAGCSIPFPQQDVHLKQVAPAGGA